MNEYLRDLRCAFSLVNKRYYFTEAYINHLVNDETTIQSTENSFSAELFRHWRNRMESADALADYTDLAIDFDLRKERFEPHIITRNTQSFRPDLVLHKSQLVWDAEFQKVYVEVKTQPNLQRASILADVQKIVNGVCFLNYRRGVFISVNSNYQTVQQLIRNIVIEETNRIREIDPYLNENWQQIGLWNRVYLFHSVAENNETRLSEPKSFFDITYG